MTNIKSVILRLSGLTIQWILVCSVETWLTSSLWYSRCQYSQYNGSWSILPQSYQHYLIRIISASVVPALPHLYHRYSSVSSLPQSYQHYLIHIIVRISPFRHRARLGRSLFSQFFCLTLFFLLVFRLFNLCYLCRERDKDRESARHLKLGKLFDSCQHKYLYTVFPNPSA